MPHHFQSRKWRKILCVMKIKLVLLLCCITQVYATNSWSQQTKIDADYKNSTIASVLEDLKAKTGYTFAHKQNEISGEIKVSASFSDATLEQVLEKVLVDNGYDYSIEGSVIVINRSGRRQQPAIPPTIVVSGCVADENGNPVAGASVIIDRTTRGTATDANGRYTLQARADEVLKVTFVGYEERLVPINGQTTVDIQLNPSAENIEEVVVTGYQTLSARESASSTFSVKADDIRTDAGFSIDQMLQGHIPGMSVIMTSGEPSATPRIRIRGNATIIGNKSPVWVVDGVVLDQDVPFTAADINSEDAEYLVGNAVSGLNPQDIETITVLKDASATAIYGVRAANGVIVITTRKGSKGAAPSIRYNGSLSLETRESYRKYDRMNSRQRVQLSREMMEAGLEYRDQPIGESYEGQYQRFLDKEITAAEFNAIVDEMQARNTDWFKHLFRTEVSQNHTLNLSGGGEKSSYYFSAGYNNTHGAAIKSQSERFNLLGKVSMQLRPWLNMDMKLDFSSTTNDGYSGQAGVNPFNYAYNTSRTQSAFTPDGAYSMYLAGNGYLYNILNELEQTGNRAKNDNFNGMLSLRADLYKGLSYQGVFSMSVANTEQREWATEYSARIAAIRRYEQGEYDETSPHYISSELPYGGILDMGNTRKIGYIVRNTLEYRNVFDGGRHAVHAMGGIEISSNKYTGHDVTGYGWNPDYGEVFMPVYTENFVRDYVNTGLLNPRNTNNVRQIASFFGTAAYTFKERYVFNANIRSDGSNKFGSDPKYRWQPTWSVAGKWIISSEGFMDNVGFVNSLALRASYGTQGNIHDDATPYLITKYGGRNGISGLEYHNIVKIPNTSLRWEKTKTWNVALDFSLLDNRITGGLDVYGKKTSDLITAKQVPSSTGQSTLTINSAQMRNSGFEGFINVDVLREGAVGWRAGFNFGRNVNEVTLVNEEIYSSTEIVDKMLRGDLAIEGDALGSLYGFRYAGLSAENGYPTFYSSPQYFDDFGIVQRGDRTYMELVNTGSIYPDLSGGFDTQVTYKGLSLELFFAYSLGAVGRLPEMFSEHYYAYNPLTNASTELIGRWRRPGDEANTDIPALYDNNAAASLAVAAAEGDVAGIWDPHELYDMSDLRVASTDFLKLKAVTLAYRLPKKLTDRLSISALNMRFQVTNLFAVANKKWKGLDPESFGANIPLMPTYSFSLDFTF